ncbi:TonB-dependent receptor [Kingella potus]|nr:TonB-dependent receptor [Kingella potus]UOP01396.1 TonB-dependent receptor [Kingella potus]
MARIHSRTKTTVDRCRHRSSETAGNHHPKHQRYRFNTVEGQAYYANNKRTGFHFSNRMRFNNKLSLTLLGDFQNEKLNSRDNFSEELADAGRKYQEEMDANDALRPNYQLNNFGAPRNGKRREYNLGFNFKYDPFHWLSLTAGARYTSFSIQDTGKRLETGVDKYGYPLIIDRGIKYTLNRVATEKEYADYLKYGELIQDPNYDPSQDNYYYFNAYGKLRIEDGVPVLDPNDENAQKELPTAYWLKDQSGRLNIAGNPITNGSIPDLHEKIANPAYDAADPESPYLVQKYRPHNSERYITAMTEAERRRAQKQGGSGWVPAFSATVSFTDKARAYLRYTESLRFPSLFEGTYGFSNAAGTFARAGYGWKPEHAKNWELGYIHDLTGLFPKMRAADFRLNYFHNTTKNIIDRDENFEFEQFDKQIRSGLELQARFDTGRFFGGIGILRNLKNKMCDESFSLSSTAESWVVDHYIQSKELVKAPACNHGGVSDSGYLASAIQPRWSVDADLGVPLFEKQA